MSGYAPHVRSTRATVMPASSRELSVSTSRHAGPSVTTTWAGGGKEQKAVVVVVVVVMVRDVQGGGERVSRWPLLACVYRYTVCNCAHY